MSVLIIMKPVIISVPILMDLSDAVAEMVIHLISINMHVLVIKLTNYFKSARMLRIFLMCSNQD